MIFPTTTTAANCFFILLIPVHTPKCMYSTITVLCVLCGDDYCQVSMCTVQLSPLVVHDHVFILNIGYILNILGN